MNKNDSFSSRLKANWLILLFGLPFASVGIALLCFSIIPALIEWQDMKNWQAIPAKVLSAQIVTHTGDDSTTWEVTSNYQYEINNQPYKNSRVGIMSGADNIGDWHQTTGQRLKTAQSKKQPITVYVNPLNPSEAIVDRSLRWGMLAFKSIFALVFGGVGLGLILFTLFKKTTIYTNEYATSSPWLANKSWANPISSGAKTGLWGAWVFAVFWNLLSVPILFVLPEELAKGNNAILIALIFPAVGALIIVWALVATLRWRRFGATPLTLNPYPGAIGGQVGGSIIIAQRLPSTSNVSVTLQCARSYFTGSGKHRKRTESIIWQKMGIAQLKLMHQGSQIEFVFDVPDGLPASELSSNNYHLWRISINANLPGPDLDRQYEIPAFAAKARSTIKAPIATDHPNLRDMINAELEQLLNLRHISGGIEINLKSFRNPSFNSVFCIVGAILLAVGLVLPSDAPAILRFAFSVIGGLFVVAGLYGLLNSYQVIINRNAVMSTRKILGVTVAKKKIDRSSIQKIALKRTSTSQSGTSYTEFFAIEATAQNQKIRIAESLKNRALAEQALESIAMLTGLPVN